MIVGILLNIIECEKKFVIKVYKMLLRKSLPFALRRSPEPSTDLCKEDNDLQEEEVAYGVSEVLGARCRGSAPPFNASVRCRYRDMELFSWWSSALLTLPTRHIMQSIMLLLLFLSPFTHARTHSAFTRDLQPISIVHQADVRRLGQFKGNESHIDHFRLLQHDGDSLLIGARNIVYNISIPDLQENINNRIMWHSKTSDSNMCFNKGKSEDACQNYVRVLVKEENDVFLICGTNAYKPLCRQYSKQENSSWVFTESSGIGKCPFDPRHNSTFVFSDGSLYSGTVADFQGITPLIFREPLKTDPNDYKQLNDPNFVHSFSFGEFVYFFFRETATEYMNCGKRVYSRVARVCKDDKGGVSNRFEKSWTSFLKSRLNCSVPGDYPYYFDEIQSVSNVISGIYGDQEEKLVYAVFTTPSNSIPGSAICAFSMQDITKAFTGSFKEQENLNSNWLPVHHSKLPTVRPGLCVNDSRSLPLDNINFIMGHPLMDQAVPAFNGHPLLMKTTFDYRFSHLAIDPQVPLVGGGKLDVIYVATDSGIILKALNAYSLLDKIGMEAVIVEEIHAVSAPIVNLRLIKGKNESSSSLIIITDTDVTGISLHRCSDADSCMSCVGLRDPYCGWVDDAQGCVALNETTLDIALQNISSGYHDNCPPETETTHITSTTLATTTVTIPPEAPSSPEPLTCAPCICPEPFHTISTIPVTEAVVIDEVYEETTLLDVEPTEDEFAEISNMIPIISKEEVNVVNNLDTELSREDNENISNALFPLHNIEIATSNPTKKVAYAVGDVFDPIVGASLGVGSGVYTAETLAIAVVVSCVGALAIGFILGFLFSRKCRSEDYSATDTSYLDSKLAKKENVESTNGTSSYSEANNKQINNLVTSYTPKNTNGKTTNSSTDLSLVKSVKCAYI